MTRLQEMDTALAALGEQTTDTTSQRKAISKAFLDSTFGEILEMLSSAPCRRWEDLCSSEQAVCAVPAFEFLDAKKLYEKIEGAELPKEMRDASYCISSNLENHVLNRHRSTADTSPFSLLAAWIGDVISDVSEGDTPERIAMLFSHYAYDGSVGKRVFCNLLARCIDEDDAQPIAFSIDALSDFRRLLKQEESAEPTWIRGYALMVERLGANTTVRDFLNEHEVDAS